VNGTTGVVTPGCCAEYPLGVSGIGRRRIALAVLGSLLAGSIVVAQTGKNPIGVTGLPPATTPPVERLGPGLLRVASIRVDTTQRQIVLTGRVNADVTTLEYIANTRDGHKAYETAFTLDADAYAFNTSLLLIGLDKANTRNAPRGHFDPNTPEGDKVEIFIECPKGECKRFPAERLIYDSERKQPVEAGSWVYTGSNILDDGRYLAHLDGVLVSFSHDPASVIELATGAGLSKYGSIVMNPTLGLSPGVAITMTIRALSPQ
jgi:hypothetical protein